MVILTPDCEICGRPGADAMCIMCGRVVCDRCFDGFEELCIECSSRRMVSSSSSGISSAGLRMLGMLFIVFGLLITTMAFATEGGEGVIIIFPFVFGNVGGWASLLLTIVFLGIFIATSLLPWIIVSRRREYGYSPYKWEHAPRASETMEYIITIDLPDRLRRTVYIEGNDGVVHLKSSVDESFYRSYSLPEGFEVDEYSYEYDGNYLLLKLKLKRSV
jgi:hypothetical protein